MTSGFLPDNAALGKVELRVAELERSLQFYVELLGMRVLQRADDAVELGARTSAPLIRLVARTGTRRRPAGMVGLYHYALLFPTRRDLGLTLLRLFQERWPFEGFADHGVSEAAYLADPDGNGIELCVDRPRELWEFKDGELAMSTAALNVNSLLRIADGEEWSGLAEGTRVGHLHLHVADLGRAETFYREVVGFDVTTRSYPGALFLSAGGYHHHLGLNNWLRTSTRDPNAAGLLGYELILPDSATRTELAQRARQHGVAVSESDVVILSDPDGTPITVRP